MAQKTELNPFRHCFNCRNYQTRSILDQKYCIEADMILAFPGDFSDEEQTVYDWFTLYHQTDMPFDCQFKILKR